MTNSMSCEKSHTCEDLELICGVLQEGGESEIMDHGSRKPLRLTRNQCQLPSSLERPVVIKRSATAECSADRNEGVTGLNNKI